MHRFAAVSDGDERLAAFLLVRAGLVSGPIGTHDRELGLSATAGVSGHSNAATVGGIKSSHFEAPLIRRRPSPGNQHLGEADHGELKMAMIQSILHLHSLRWSQRRIARELDIDRGTVGRYLSRHLRPPNAAISPPGSDAANAATFSGLPAPGDGASGHAAGADFAARSNAAIPPTGSEAFQTAPNTAIPPAGDPLGQPLPEPSRPSPDRPSAAGRKNACEPWRELIQAKLDQGLSAQRVWQDLSAEAAFTAGYDSVIRFVRRLTHTRPWPFRRLECGPGDEGQADFGQGAPVITAEGKRKKTHLFRIVLSHSRKAYSETTYRQTTDDFLRALENAFWHFGGVPKVLVIDNLKAAVKQPDWYDPELVPKVAAFAAHYGVAILPTKPRMPRHKGKTERGID